MFAEAVQVGTILGSVDSDSTYEVLDVLGHGGFGITYLCKDLTSGLKIAVKEYLPGEFATRDVATRTIIPKRPTDAENFEFGLQSFLEEAQQLESLDHPHIVKIRDFFEANNTAYIAMDYVGGESLQSKVDKHGKMSPGEVHAWLSGVLEALDYIHAKDLYHRDISPSNIVLSDSLEQAVLIDFGSARMALGSHSQTLATILKPGFAPREQYSKRHKLRPTIDIYALGATVYFCLTGIEMAEFAAPERDLAVNEGETDPLLSITELVQFDQTDMLLASLVDEMMALASADRPQSIKEIRRTLSGKRIAPQPAPPSVPEPPPKKGHILKLVSVGATAALLAAIIVPQLIEDPKKPVITVPLNKTPQNAPPSQGGSENSESFPVKDRRHRLVVNRYAAGSQMPLTSSTVILKNKPASVRYDESYTELEEGYVDIKVVAAGYQPVRREFFLDTDLELVATMCKEPQQTRECTTPSAPPCYDTTNKEANEVTGFGYESSGYGEASESQVLKRAKADAKDSLYCGGRMGTVRYRDRDCDRDYVVVRADGLRAYSYDCSVEAYAECTMTRTERVCPSAPPPACKTVTIPDSLCANSTINIQ